MAAKRMKESAGARVGVRASPVRDVKIAGIVGSPRDLFTGVGVHLRNVLAAATRHHYAVPSSVDVEAAEVMQSGMPTFLHGDLTPVNLLRAPDCLRVLDTCGYTGPAEFDAARWCARVGGSHGAVEMLARWLEVETALADEEVGDPRELGGDRNHLGGVVSAAAHGQAHDGDSLVQISGGRRIALDQDDVGRIAVVGEIEARSKQLLDVLALVGESGVPPELVRAEVVN